MPRITPVWIPGALAALLAIGGCGRRPASEPARAAIPLPLRIVADSGRGSPLPVRPIDGARAWISSVSRRPPPPSMAPAAPGPSELDLPPPDARPETLAAETTPAPSLALDDDLKPPIPRQSATLRLPRWRGRPQSVELDVHVDERGEVSDALWAGGSADSAAVAATVTCALGMRFYPAIRHGVPVAVWCRQRFELGHEGVARPAGDRDP